MCTTRPMLTPSIKLYISQDMKEMEVSHRVCRVVWLNLIRYILLLNTYFIRNGTCIIVYHKLETLYVLYYTSDE